MCTWLENDIEGIIVKLMIFFNDDKKNYKIDSLCSTKTSDNSGEFT